MSYNHKVKRYSNEAILLDYLREKIDVPFGAHNIQTDTVIFARVVYGKYVTSETLARLWRQMRNKYKSNKYDSAIFKNGFHVKEMKKVDGKDSKQKYYLVTHNRELIKDNK